MQISSIWLLIAWSCTGVILVIASEKQQETWDCGLDKEMENQCATYCYKAIKPLLHIVHQSQPKDIKLAKLEKEVQELKLQLAVYKEKESMSNELLGMAANIVDIKKQLLNSPSKDHCTLQTKEKIVETTTARTIEKPSEVLPNSCLSAANSTQLQTIKVPGMDMFVVPCNGQIAGSGWTLIQQRLNGNISFYRNWDAYREGFGKLNADFFIGLEKLHYMLASQPHELYIWMEHVNKDIRYAHYDNFRVGDENSGFKLLSLGSFLGNSTNALRRNLDMKFTTHDRDNDLHRYANCADIFKDAWWHAACSDSNLNGIYNDALHCIYWYQPLLKNNSDCLKTVKMLIRPTAQQ